MRPMTYEAEEKWYNNAATSEQDVGFVIYERATLRPSGGTGLHRINHVHRSAECGSRIGEKDGGGKGYGRETARSSAEHGAPAPGAPRGVASAQRVAT